MSTTEALLPCPFCGGSDIGEGQVVGYSIDSSFYTFGCRDCGAVFIDGEAGEWNRRAAIAKALNTDTKGEGHE